MSTKEAHLGEVNTPQKDSYVAYHADLMARLEGDVGLLFLLHAIAHFRTDHQPLRNFWERYWNDDKRKPDELRTDYELDYNYWDRAWNMRQKACRIIDGREPWPREFRQWKAMQELRYHHGRRARPPWLDASPQRVSIKESLADARRQRRKARR